MKTVCNFTLTNDADGNRLPSISPNSIELFGSQERDVDLRQPTGVF